MGRGSTLRGRGSQSVGRGCILGGQGLLCSKITNMVNFAASEISRYGQTDLPRDTPSHRVAWPATKKKMSNVAIIFHGLIGKGSKFNETVNLACANEFVVNGTNSTDIQLRCTENGTWEEFPGCVVSHCKPSDLIAIQGTILANHALQAK